MSNLVNVVLAIFIVAQFQEIKCNPLYVEKEIGSVPRNVRVFKPDKKEWVHFHHSWGLPHFPSLTSVSNLFQDEEDKEKIATKNRLAALEKNQKEILALLQKLSNEMTATKDQAKPQSINEKPQTPTVDNKKPTVPSTVPSTIPSTVSTSVPSTVSSSASSTTSSTPVTHAPTIQTTTVQDPTQQPQSSPSSPSSEESQPQIPDQNENANSNLNSNTGDNQASADSAGQQSSPSPDMNSGSIVAFSPDENEKVPETTESTA